MATTANCALVAQVLETRLRQAQTEAMTPIGLISCLVSNELTRRSERLLERHRKRRCRVPTLVTRSGHAGSRITIISRASRMRSGRRSGVLNPILEDGNRRYLADGHIGLSVASLPKAHV